MKAWDLSELEKKQIAAMYRYRIKLKTISEMYGVTMPAVIYVARSRGLKPRYPAMSEAKRK